MRLTTGEGQGHRELLLGAARITESLFEQLRERILRLDALGALRHRGDETAQRLRGVVPRPSVFLQPRQTLERARVPPLVAQHLAVGVSELARIGTRPLALARQDLDVAIPAPLPAIQVFEQRQRAAVLRLELQRRLSRPRRLVELRAPGLGPERDLHPKIGRLLAILEAGRDVGGGGDELPPDPVAARDPLHFLDHPPAGRILGERRLQRDQRPIGIAEPPLINLGNSAEYRRPLPAHRRRLGLRQELLDPRRPVFGGRRLQRRLGIEGVGAQPSLSPPDH